MCGIAGRLSRDPPPRTAVLEAMAARLRHRGPDAAGVMVDGPLGLAHRRLAILDLTDAGNQPMADASGRFRIVYNGEVYNFRELRRELEGLGSRFTTRTDTEVILEAYKRWGEGCLQRFNGMFAFALWDGVREELLLARDRLGKKPLFYYPLPGGGVVFASELKALLADPQLPREVNPTALGHFLSLNYTLTDEPMVAGVARLPAAHCLTVDGAGRVGEPRCYWDLAAHFHAKRRVRDGEEVLEGFRELLTDAIRLRLVSDVPLGVFLSGGVDSSTVVALMAGLVPPGELKSYTIGFTEATYSEVESARLVAGSLGITPRVRVLEPGAAGRLARVAWYCDEPFADSSLFPMMELSRFAREEVTVALSGDGADELLAGYTTYTADQLHRWLHRVPGWAVGLASRAVARLVPVTFNKIGFDYKIRQFLGGLRMPQDRAHLWWRTIFDDREKREVVLPAWREAVAAADPYRTLLPHFQAAAGLHPLDRAMYVDIKSWLVDDILVKVDRTTMAASLEVRVPFLDYRLVEFAASLPVEWKMRGMRRKHLLKQPRLAGLPRQVLERPKEGFNAPISHWLESMGEELFGDLERRPLAGELLEQGKVAALWAEHRARRRDNGLRLLGLVMLHHWWEGVLHHAGGEPPE